MAELALKCKPCSVKASRAHRSLNTNCPLREWPILLSPMELIVEAINQTTWRRTDIIIRWPILNPWKEKEEAIKQTKRAVSRKNRKPTEGKRKSITISQLDGYEDYCRNIQDVFSKIILNGTSIIRNCTTVSFVKWLSIWTREVNSKQKAVLGY